MQKTIAIYTEYRLSIKDTEVWFILKLDDGCRYKLVIPVIQCRRNRRYRLSRGRTIKSNTGHSGRQHRGCLSGWVSARAIIEKAVGQRIGMRGIRQTGALLLQGKLLCQNNERQGGNRMSAHCE